MSKPNGYLPKLRALGEIQPASSRDLSRHMGIGFETARTALHRLEAAKFVRGVRELKRHGVASVMYSLTKTGAEAVKWGAEPSVPRDGYVTTAEREEANNGPREHSWRGLHEAFGMGEARMPQWARRGPDPDREPEWRAQA